MFGPIVAHLERRWTQMVQQHVKGRLLDIGCGPNRLVREYGNGVGVDVRDWGDVDQIIDDAGALPFEDSTFDTVSIVAALNHIPNREAALSEAWRVLRPNGQLLVTMIGPRLSRFWHNLLGHDDPDQHERGHFEDGEVWGIGVADMITLIQHADFQFVERKTFVMGLNSLYIAEKKYK